MEEDEGIVLRVVRGAPTDEEVVAVVLALDLAAEADRAAKGPAARPGWSSAARVEAVGPIRVSTPTDIAAARREAPTRR